MKKWFYIIIINYELYTWKLIFEHDSVGSYENKICKSHLLNTKHW